MPTKRCCCSGLCYTFEDDFQRADSTDLGIDWAECSGTWDIASGRLVTSTAGYVVLKHMVGNPYGILTTRILRSDINANIGAKYLWYVFKGTEPTPCATTADHWLFEMQVISTSEAILRVHEFGTLLVERQILFSGTQFEFSICVSNDVISGDSVDLIGPPAWFCPNGPADFYFAVGSGGTGLVAWDWVGYSDEYYNNILCPKCDRSCCCPCVEAENGKPPLRLEIYAPDCPHMHGVHTIITCTSLPNECCVWTGPPLVFGCPDDMFCDPLGNPISYSLTPIMQCALNSEENPCSGYRLWMIWTPGSGNFQHCLTLDTGGIDLKDQQKPVNADCNCAPVYLQFDGYTLRKAPGNLQNCCMCCTEFSVIVTEA